MIESRAQGILVALLLGLLPVGAAAQESEGAATASERRVLPYPLMPSAAFRAAIEAGTRTDRGLPGPEYHDDEARYTLEVELDPARARLKARARIHHVNRSRQPERALVLHLRGNIHRPDALRLVPVAINDGVEIQKIELGDRVLSPGEYRVSGTKLTVPLSGKALPMGEGVDLGIEWTSVVPDQGGAPRGGHEGDETFFINYWYPQLAVREDVRGIVADPYLGPGEFYMGYADYDLTVSVPAGYLVQAAGELQNPEEVLAPAVLDRWKSVPASRELVHLVTADDFRDGPTLKPTDGRLLAWHFKAEQVRDCAISIGNRYLWDARALAIVGPDGKDTGLVTRIQAFYRGNRPNWARAVEYAAHAIDWMSRRVAPYPWPHMSICEGIGGGMEYPMMTLIGEDGDDRMLQYVVCHETIHMWFPMLVGSDEKSFGFMDEGMTTFLQQLVQEDFWKTDEDRLGYYRTWKRIARRASEVICMHHADRFSTATQDQGHAVYTKPCVAFHQLRFMLSDATFFAALRAYAEAWSYKHPLPDDLFAIFSRVAGQDLSWYFRIWFFENWSLDTGITAVEEVLGRTRVRLDDLDLAYGPTTVEVTHRDGSKERQVVPAEYWGSGRTTIVLEFGPEVEKVQLDPDGHALDCNGGNDLWRKGRLR